MHYQPRSKAVIHEYLDGEIILADLDAGIYFSIRGSGIAFWQLLLSGATVDQIGALFKQKYQSDYSAELNQFLHQLLEENLLIEGEIGEKQPVDSIYWTESFEPCVLEKYEEMKNLLMLDPIHEVDEQGWPLRKN